MTGELILGIDLGTTHSAVGAVDSGFPILLADRDGRRITPSAVWFGEDGAIEVGRRALRRRSTEPGRVVTSIKRLMGRRYGEELDFCVPMGVSADGRLMVLGRTPEEVSAEILRELKGIAENRLERSVDKAVITVPAYFNDAQRAATKRAGELAGMEVVRILSEPTAAALAYGLDKLGERARVAVYDLGGGTFDLSVLEMQDGVFQVLATRGDTRLGGDDLDLALARHGAARGGVDFDRLSDAAKVRLIEEAERVKRVLSERDTESFLAPFYDGSSSLEIELTRAELESLARPFIARSLNCCRQALADAGCTAAELDAVVLVGGSTRIPAVRHAVAELFGREPDLSQHPDEAVALGATIQAGVLGGTLRKMVLLDVTPLSLGIETFGGLMNVIIPRNTTIPCKAGEMFTNAAAGQSSMRVRVLQGEREMARDNWELGNFEVPFEAAPKGQARVGVQFRIDENGILEVLARDVATGRDTVIEIRDAAVDVDDEEVGKMVGESVEHAFDDMAERIFTEARLKAEELLPAVEQALAAAGDLVSETEREEIVAAAREVRVALEGGLPNPLKAAVQRLDQSTEAFAAALVERAMAEALERRLS
ncbi:MAG: molecular chaperone DnaK [Verrucomicrobia bacterium]|nr:MAG: molecular chaperone DnaK [Verrucomicrobiota bacterium]TAE88489.1 MAG: molecular chaperone DnaK [Verrucomicrobiota bacterium]TAF26944.1 MAG: molecular chaperone DnaK [Verrucomicrobiota bacterium]TAF42201.1 MAG: molecular chaperone DnaK [Verrucomicrobiota bacterium]